MKSDLDYLLSPQAIRDRARDLFERAVNGKSAFRYHPDRLLSTVDTVLDVIREKYPSLNIPFHSRWGHFRAGGVDRVMKLDKMISNLDVQERARVKIDLVIPSVLLDAGAGMGWKFKEDGKIYQRSEGLALASLDLFYSGSFSGDGRLRTDSSGLEKFELASLRKFFQVTDANPLVGEDGRVTLLKNLGKALKNSRVFPGERPGGIVDYLAAQGREVPATAVLRAVLDGLGAIWPGRISLHGVNLGDVWRHSQLGQSGSIESLVPFHKLSQWLTYSLIEPIEEAGVKVRGVEELTGLAEYRNGGLILDSGLVSLANPADAAKEWSPSSELVIEWRALTVHLLDQIGAEVQKALGKTPAEFPLAKVLEGGTWWAGRKLAAQLRSDGGPPLKIKSDGTVF